MISEGARPWVLALLLVFLQGCGSRPVNDSAPSNSRSSVPADPVPRAEPRSRYGNGPYYQVYGITYKVLETNYGYHERGVASWYGKKFHGRPTSSQETYDMYAMTAAHKSLPIPSYAEVRNLRNGKTIVVRVNDRGPFVDNRLIDLSYAAALKIDMVTDGTSLVEVTAISFDQPTNTQSPSAPPASAQAAGIRESVYVQVGAFGEPENARRRFAMLRDMGIDDAFVHKDENTSPALYRVRIGPIANVSQFDAIVQTLQEIGISETHLVTD
jgi:rare lipoprotein A